MAAGPVARKTAYAQKIARAVDLRDQGHTWDEVAQMAGWANAQNACNAVSRYLNSHPLARTAT